MNEQEFNRRCELEKRIAELEKFVKSIAKTHECRCSDVIPTKFDCVGCRARRLMEVTE